MIPSNFTLTDRLALFSQFDERGELEIDGVEISLRCAAEVPQAFTVGIVRRHIFRIITDQHEAFEQFLALVTRERRRKTDPFFHQISVTNHN